MTVPIAHERGSPSRPKTFGLRLTSASGAVLTEPDGIASITDDDGRAARRRFTIGAAEVVEGSGGTGRVLRMPVTRAPRRRPDVSSLSWAVVGGTATPARTSRPERGADDPAARRRDDRHPLVGDDAYEGDETVVVRLSDVYAGTLGTSQATGTIRDDDPAPPPVQQPSAPAAPAAPPRRSPRRRSSRCCRRRRPR